MIRNSYILLKASYVANFAYGLFAPVYAIFVQNIGGTILDAGIAYSIYGICSGGFIIAFGSSDFFKRNVKKIIIVGYATYSLVYYLYMFIDSPQELFCLQILIGLATGILEPSWSAVFSAKQSEGALEKNWAIWTGGVGMISGIAALLGGYIATHSFPLLFFIMGSSTLVSTVIVVRLLKRETIIEKLEKIVK